MVGNFVKTFTKPLFQTNEYITVDGIIPTLPFNQSEIDDELMEIRIGSIHPGPKNPPLTNDSSNYEAIECGNYEMTALFAFKGCINFFVPTTKKILRYYFRPLLYFTSLDRLCLAFT